MTRETAYLMSRRDRQNPFGQRWMESGLIWVFAITPTGNGCLTSYQALMGQRSMLMHCSLIETTHSGLEPRMTDFTVSTMGKQITLEFPMGCRTILLFSFMSITRGTLGCDRRSDST